jgi:transcriptional regulator with XRE-family HTH domain
VDRSEDELTVIEICEGLAARRAGLGWSVDELAERAECDIDSVLWVEEADATVPVDALQSYARAVGCRLTLGLQAGEM